MMNSDSKNKDEIIDLRLGPYDQDPEAEADLWFLPASDVSLSPEGEFRRPDDVRNLCDAAAWQAAQGALAPAIAALAFDAGRLAERLVQFGEGARLRLALQEAVALGAWSGDRVAADRLALWLMLHLSGAGDDAPALSRLSWAVRHLLAPPNHREGGAWLAAELGVAAQAERVQEAAEALQGLGPLHPVARACALFQVWRFMEATPQRLLEGAVLGARAAGDGTGGFLPLALAGASALTVDGPVAQRLSGWVSGQHRAVLAALLHLDRLRLWLARTEEGTRDLSGRTPGRLIAALLRIPLLSAPVAAAETGSSRAAVQRNLDRLRARGLIREVTGGGRFRVWTAHL